MTWKWGPQFWTNKTGKLIVHPHPGPNPACTIWVRGVWELLQQQEPPPRPKRLESLSQPVLIRGGKQIFETRLDPWDKLLQISQISSTSQTCDVAQEPKHRSTQPGPRNPWFCCERGPAPSHPFLHSHSRCCECSSLQLLKNYTSIDPKQQRTMFPRRSCAIKNSLRAPFLRKETKEKKGDKPRNPSPEPEGARKSRWNTILFPSKGKERIRGKQAPEP